MKQLFIFLFVTTCFIACNTEEDDSFRISSNKTTVVNEIKEDVQENANQVNQFLLDKLSVVKTRGLEKTNEYPDFYGGSIVNEDGSLTILLSGDSATSVKAIKKITNSSLLHFKKCLFSYQKLSNIMSFLNKNIMKAPNLLKGEIAGFGIDEQENRLEIWLVHKNDFIISLFNSFFKHPAIKFRETGKIIEAASDNIYICPGYKLGLDLTDLEHYGSFGFSARELDGEKRVGMVTAGHVVEVTGRNTFYQDDVFGNSSKVIRKGTVDAAFVPRLLTSFVPSNAINGDYKAVLSKITSLPGVGTYVNKWGACTGHSGGKITTTKFTKVDDNNNPVITDMTAASLSCKQGDSGGIIYTYISSKNTRLTVGILHGFPESNPNITVFSKADNVLKELNVERY